MSNEFSTKGAYVTGGDFTRDTNYIQDRIVADPRPEAFAQGEPQSSIGHPHAGLGEGAQLWPVEAGRYRLVAARACPWANRTLIARRLLGLEDAISVALPGPTHDARSWTFDLDKDGKDPVLGTERVQENYFKRFADYPRGITVPAIVDIPTGAVVTNDYPQITWDFSTQWKEFHREGAPNLIPEGSLEEMLPLIKRIFTEVNNGVYRAGFAGDQQSYNDAYDRLFTTLDYLEERLETRRFLMGDHISEADIRLFTTLARFDPVYHGHFKANRNKLTDMPNLWGYARDLFQTPGFGDTTDFEQIKSHYYVVHEDINPTQIVPKGPDLSNWLESHGREELATSGPFLDGTAPAEVRPEERVTAGHNPLYPA
ncbi:glutathione S-transferase C-terminal domain-containing protein [Arthrobacter sp. MYb213]|uniref:glutathione S-transferase C-terminal domain-containing protein n=1 Tax=Arthrobacter sp. MYb213 TaxID=1848595 RepID=UPI000CFCF651|nr:glutathione S-transferase C-terminal domain-containing protein [Arthrobacter sp. MYb213]PRB71644.1 glutathione-dependent reductase [Arthrobacter sp. MYb213]